MAHNDEAGGSRTGGEDPYLSMLGQYTSDVVMEEADDEMEEPREDEAPSGSEDARRGDGDPGNETTTSGGGETANETTTSGSEAKRKRKKRTPNKLGTTRNEFTEVDPKSGIPTKPEKYAKGYGNQIGCITRDFANINDENIRGKENLTLAALLIEKLHVRYKFPEPYNNQDLVKNIVNTQALGKFTKALGTWKGQVREMLDEGSGFDEIKAVWPSISEDDLELFQTIEDSAAKKKQRKWGKDMREKNIAPHNLGSRGYLGKEPVWAKQDSRREGPDPYDKIKDPQAKKIIRARFRDHATSPGELLLNAKVKELEKKIVEEEEKAQHDQSEGSSNQKAPHVTPFLRALNETKKVPLEKPPHRGRVVGAGMGHKHSFYYPDTKEKRKERKMAEQANTQASIEDAVAKTINSLMPTICESVGAWIEGGKQGPPPMISLGASNSATMAPIVQNPAANPNSPRDD